jgi:hypothetical protein
MLRKMASSNISKRTGHDQLPHGQEILAILAREAKRPVAPGKENLHLAKFDLIIEWLKRLNLPVDFFTQEPSERLEEAIIMPEDVQENLAKATLEKVQSSPGEIVPLLKQITKYLGESDSPCPSDVIFVFGSPGIFRIETAVDLYKKGLAPKLFITGGRPFYKPEAESEAVKFRQFTIDNGVPSEAISIHDNAVSIADNVRGGLNRLDKLGIKHDSIILVTSWFVQRRCWAHMMKYAYESTKLYRVNARSNPAGGLTESDWYKNEKGIKTVAAEFFKLRVSEILNTS